MKSFFLLICIDLALNCCAFIEFDYLCIDIRPFDGDPGRSALLALSRGSSQ